MCLEDGFNVILDDDFQVLIFDSLFKNFLCNIAIEDLVNLTVLLVDLVQCHIDFVFVKSRRLSISNC
jgi:hypothetical protein